MSSWLGSLVSSHPTHPEQSSNNLNKQKHKQIDSLREQVPGVVEIKTDEQYSLTITINDITLILNIFLPVRFPLVSPEVTITPPIKHHWVNDQMVVDGSPLLKNFTVHSKLGRAIEQVIKEFHEHPPQLLSASLLHYPGSGVSATPQTVIPGMYASTSDSSFTPYTFSSPPQASGHVDVPDSPSENRRAPVVPAGGGASASANNGRRMYKCPPLPEVFDEIREISTKDLRKFLTDSEGPVLVDNFVSQLDVIEKVQVDREHLFQDNEDQAGLNLSHEPALQDGWTQLQEKFLIMENLKENYEKQLKEQSQLIERYQQRNIVARLKMTMNEADTDSEIFADEFLDAKISVTNFTQKYKQMRKLYHLRKTKYEKLSSH